MNESYTVMPGLDGQVALWIAISLAASFLLVILFDSMRRKRARGRTHGRPGAMTEANPGGGFFKRLRIARQEISEEMARRERRSGRDRDREK